MHRVACSRPALNSIASHPVRAFSTPPPASPLRKPVVKWGNIVIPSRQEVNEIKAKRQTDISYLKFENQNSLAARLARPTIDITLARQQAEAKKAQATKANTEQPPSQKEEEIKSKDSQPPSEDRTPTPSVAATIETMITQRREARLLRESARHALKQKQERERRAREEKEEERRLNTQSKVHSTIKDLRPLSDQLALPARPVDTDDAERRARIMKLATELAAKRKAERLEREIQESASIGRSRDPMPYLSKRAPSSSQKRRQEAFEIQPSEESTTSASEPEFKGPEAVSSNLFEVYRPAAEMQKYVTSLNSGRRGDYSSYVSPSLPSFATPPDELGAARLAEMTLSHRRDVSIPSRKHTVELVAAALQPKPGPGQKSP